MARIRTIKPEFWLNEELAFCSESSRLLAIGLLNQSDDEGFFKANHLLLKAAIFPFMEPSMSVPECIKQLVEIGYIRLFHGSDGKEYGCVVNFNKHQTVSRPTPSKIKGLETDTPPELPTHGALREDSTPERKGTGKGKEQGTGSKTLCHAEPSHDEMDSEIQPEFDETPQPNQKPGTNLELVAAKPRPLADAVQEIFEHWQRTMQHPKAALDDKRRRTITKALKLGYSVNDLKSAVTGCSLTPHNMGQNDRGQRYDSVDLIFRDADHIERFMRHSKSPPRPQNRSDQRLHANVAAAQEFLSGGAR